jgi:hypothetical protein
MPLSSKREHVWCLLMHEKAQCVPGWLLTGQEFYALDNIEISSKTAMADWHCEGAANLIYQETPDISDIFFMLILSDYERTSRLPHFQFRISGMS